MPVIIANKQRKRKIDSKKLAAAFELICEKADCKEAEVSVKFVSDASIRRINRHYRGVDKPTDCISFPMREGEPITHPGRAAPELLGDIVISVETAARQNKDLHEEITFLFIHGLLHLLGYDHMTPADEKKMKQRENELLAFASSLPRTRHMVNTLKGGIGGKNDKRRV